MSVQDLTLEPWAQIVMGGFSEGSHLPASNIYTINSVCIPKPYWGTLNDIQWIERRIETARWDLVAFGQDPKDLIAMLSVAWVRDWMIKEKIRNIIRDDPTIKLNIRKNTFDSFEDEHIWHPGDLGINVFDAPSKTSSNAYKTVLAATLFEHTDSKILRIESLLPPNKKAQLGLWNFVKYKFISKVGPIGRVAAKAFDECLDELAEAALRFDCYQKDSEVEEALRFISSCISSHRSALFVLNMYDKKKHDCKKPSALDFMGEAEDELDNWPRALSLRGFCKLGEEMRLSSSSAKNVQGLSLQDFLLNKGSLKENKAIAEANQKVYNFCAVEQTLPQNTEHLIGYGCHRFGYDKEWKLVSVDGKPPTDKELLASTLSAIDEAKIEHDIKLGFLIAENSHYA